MKANRNQTQPKIIYKQIFIVVNLNWLIVYSTGYQNGIMLYIYNAIVAIFIISNLIKFSIHIQPKFFMLEIHHFFS